MKLKMKEIITFLKKIKNDYPVMIFFIISNFINALLLRILTTGSFSIRAFLFDMGFVLLLGSLSMLVKKKNRNIYYIIVSFIMVACCIINSIYYNYYNSFVSISLLATSVFVKDVGDAVVDFALKASDWIYLWEFIGLYIVIKSQL